MDWKITLNCQNSYIKHLSVDNNSAKRFLTKVLIF